MNHITIRHKAGIVLNNAGRILAGNVLHHHYSNVFCTATYCTTAILDRVKISFFRAAQQHIKIISVIGTLIQKDVINRD